MSVRKGSSFRRGTTYTLRMNNAWITTIVPKFSGVLKHIGKFLANASRDGLFKNFSGESFETTLQAIDFPPQSRKFVPAHEASIAEQIFARLDLYKCLGKFAFSV